MSDVLMLEAALFQLRSGAEGIDPMYAAQIDLCLTVLGNAIDGARDGINTARVNDIDFALRDLTAAFDELPADEAARLEPGLQMLRGDLDSLRRQTTLDQGVIDGIRALQSKLRTRRAAIERQTYREGGGEAPLPHPPEELRRDAQPLRAQLAAAGFTTPSLDALIDDPSSLRFHSINDIIDDLDVIVSS